MVQQIAKPHSGRETKKLRSNVSSPGRSVSANIQLTSWRQLVTDLIDVQRCIYVLFQPVKCGGVLNSKCRMWQQTAKPPHLRLRCEFTLCQSDLKCHVGRFATQDRSYSRDWRWQKLCQKEGQRRESQESNRMFVCRSLVKQVFAVSCYHAVDVV